ncbi:hypothetical protein K438DRAFT_1980044 [Mycena galopus ATCC 62051]|nr:hypothetical protein K438DRAFT_1980044 [Mycena galopus ATCC 62051]
MFDNLLDRMVLSYEAKLRDKLFKFLNMEQVLFWLSFLGFGVAWSANYEQLLE